VLDPRRAGLGGKNFGAIFTPRIGQEVIVDFLEGDPDQPGRCGQVVPFATGGSAVRAHPSPALNVTTNPIL
jgi:uncharacterized protein involved in type VI secretion and phage assembly